MSSGIRMRSGIGSWWAIAAVALGVLALIFGGWAFALQNRVDNLEKELAAVRANATASVFTLGPTDRAPATARGQVFLSLTGSGVVTASNLPQPGDNEAYHLWFLTADGKATSGGVLAVDQQGQGFALIPADSTAFAQIAVSLEPVGTASTDGTWLLIGDVDSGNG